MRSKILITLIVVAVPVCATAAEAPEPFAPGDILIVSTGDPNDPNGAVPPTGEGPNQTWNPAEHLRADWEYIAASMTSRLYNPAFRRSTDTEGPRWSLSMMSAVYLTDAGGLVGWSWLPKSVLALDPEGRVVTSSTSSSSMVRWYKQPVFGRSGVLPLNWITLNLPLDPGATYPDLFGRVEWTMNVLLAEEVATVDVPFKASDTWVELTPGMEILVERATVDQGMYQYCIKVRYDATAVDYLTDGSFHPWHDVPPAAVVLRMDVLDAEGKSIRDSSSRGFSSSSSFSRSNDQITGTTSGNGTCSACGTAATIRHTLAFGLCEQEVRLAVENIPAPQF